MKDRIQILASEQYLTRSDIMVMLQVSRQVANRIFAEAERREKESHQFRAEPSKVLKTTVEDVSGTKCTKILSELKKADALPSNPRMNE